MSSGDDRKARLDELVRRYQTAEEEDEKGEVARVKPRGLTRRQFIGVGGGVLGGFLAGWLGRDALIHAQKFSEASPYEVCKAALPAGAKAVTAYEAINDCVDADGDGYVDSMRSYEEGDTLYILDQVIYATPPVFVEDEYAFILTFPKIRGARARYGNLDFDMPHESVSISTFLAPNFFVETESPHFDLAGSYVLFSSPIRRFSAADYDLPPNYKADFSRVVWDFQNQFRENRLLKVCK